MRDSEETVPALVPTLVPPEEPKSGVDKFLVAGAAFLMLLLALYWALLHKPTEPSAPAVAPLSAPEKAPAKSQAAQPAPSEGKPLDSERSTSRASRLPGSDRSVSVSQAKGRVCGVGRVRINEDRRRANRPCANRRGPCHSSVCSRRGDSRRAAGTEVFVDDRLVASTSPDGRTSVSGLGPGQHRLRLRSNGYKDYDQAVDVRNDQTSTITAKLEPRFSRLCADRRPAQALAPLALPPPVIAIRPSAPDFALDRTLKAHTGWVTGVAFNPDGQQLVSGSWDRSVRFWEVSTGEQLQAVTGKMKEVQALAFSRDGHLLATENSSNIATLRDPATGREIRVFPTDKPLGVLGSNWVYSIAFSPDGQWLASGVDDKTVRLWDVKTGQKVRDLAGSRRQVMYIAFSPDGRLLATGDDEKDIGVWNLSTGKEIFKLSGHMKPVHAVAFSPNGRWLASASGDKTVKLWDMTSGREVRTLAGHGNSVTSLAFSPDGRWLASGSWDKTVKIWDVETGREVQTLAGHDRPVYSIAYDSRGRWLASGSEDGTIKLWRLGDAAGVRPDYTDEHWALQETEPIFCNHCRSRSHAYPRRSR